MNNNKITSFNTGAIRDNQDNKEDYLEGISWLALKRYSEYMTKKAKKYGRGNWQKGIPPDNYITSMLRHIQKFIAEWNYGICTEKDDHLSAICFNLFGLMHELELYRYKKGRFNVSHNYKRLYLNKKEHK